MRATSEWMASGRKGNRPKGELVVVTGGPGSGKSYVIKKIDETADELELAHPKLALMASAANVINGRTLHSATGMTLMGPSTSLSGQKLKKLKKLHQVGTIWGIIIDEISAVTYTFFHETDKRFQRIMDCTLPFGGLSVFVFGDFFQLPPPAGPKTSLFDAVIKTHVHHDPTNDVMRLAANVFVQFQKMDLTVNIRAQDDPEWAALLAKLRSDTPNKFAIRDHLVPLLDKLTLTEEEIADDNKWRQAPICVSGNLHRYALARARARDIACKLGVPLVMWKLPLKGRHPEALSVAQLEKAYDDPRLWGMFIQGGPVVLNENIRPDRLVSNGTNGVFSSLCLGTEDEDSGDFENGAVLTDQARIDSAVAGEVIILETPPFSVNVRLILQNGAHARDYDDVSISLGKATIPIMCKHHSKMLKVYVEGLGIIELNTCSHGLDLPTAVTFYKAQGRTMDRVIACLNDPCQPPKLSFEAIFVFLSRVKHGKNCRILPLHNGANWDHLKDLQPATNCIAYMQGFDSKGSWSKTRAQEALRSITKGKKAPKKKTGKRTSPDRSSSTPTTALAGSASKKSSTGSSSSGSASTRSFTGSSSSASTSALPGSSRPTVDGDGSRGQLKRPLTEREAHAVQETWDYSEGWGFDEVVCTLAAGAGFSLVGIRGKHFDRLRSGWLFDETVNGYLYLLSERDARICAEQPRRWPTHFFSSFFFVKMFVSNEYSYGSVKRWSKKVKSTGGCVFKLDKLVVPVHVSDSHWCLAVAHVQKRRLKYYDSLGGEGHKYLNGLQLYLLDEAKKFTGVTGVDQSLLDVANWEVVPGGQMLTPQQANCDDCGVFTCIYANYVSADLPLGFTAADMPLFRKRITLDILRNKVD